MSIKHASVTLATVASLVLVAASADAGAPPESCQKDAPHHTQTFGANTDSISFTSTHPYWDNACGCYIAQVEVPSTSSPTNGNKLPQFQFGAGLASGAPADKADCESYKLRVYVYKKEGNDWTLKYGGHTTGTWNPNPGFPGIKCAMSANYTSTSFAPPASGTDKYRVLAAVEMNGKNKAVTVTATRLPNIK
jgi:hypothetical protein